MCPYCITTTVLAAAGTASGAGLTGLIAWLQARVVTKTGGSTIKTKEN
jgi:hypothetical protein